MARIAITSGLVQESLAAPLREAMRGFIIAAGWRYKERDVPQRQLELKNAVMEIGKAVMDFMELARSTLVKELAGEEEEETAANSQEPGSTIPSVANHQEQNNTNIKEEAEEDGEQNEEKVKEGKGKGKKGKKEKQQKEDKEQEVNMEKVRVKPMTEQEKRLAIEKQKDEALREQQAAERKARFDRELREERERKEKKRKKREQKTQAEQTQREKKAQKKHDKAKQAAEKKKSKEDAAARKARVDAEHKAQDDELAANRRAREESDRKAREQREKAEKAKRRAREEEEEEEERRLAREANEKKAREEEEGGEDMENEKEAMEEFEYSNNNSGQHHVVKDNDEPTPAVADIQWTWAQDERAKERETHEARLREIEAERERKRKEKIEKTKRDLELARLTNNDILAGVNEDLAALDRSLSDLVSSSSASLIVGREEQQRQEQPEPTQNLQWHTHQPISQPVPYVATTLHNHQVEQHQDQHQQQHQSYSSQEARTTDATVAPVWEQQPKQRSVQQVTNQSNRKSSSGSVQTVCIPSFYSMSVHSAGDEVENLTFLTHLAEATKHLEYERPTSVRGMQAGGLTGGQDYCQHENLPQRLFPMLRLFVLAQNRVCPDRRQILLVRAYQSFAQRPSLMI